MKCAGYGELKPATKNAQIFCVFYALIGIPLLASFLYGVGLSLSRLVNKSNIYRACVRHRRLGAALTAAVLFLVGVGIWISIAAYLFTLSEGWDYWQGWYYSFITLSTIGFGDLIPGKAFYFI